jgi:DNA-binding LytR/AlgR family response regulator
VLNGEGEIGKSSTSTIITGYDAVSLKRFSSVAASLILKPFDIDQLQIALDTAKSKIIRARTELASSARPIDQPHSPEKPHFLKRVAAESGETIVLINVKDILWLQSSGDHIRIHVATATHLVRPRRTSRECSTRDIFSEYIAMRSSILTAYMSSFYLQKATCT